MADTIWNNDFVSTYLTLAEDASIMNKGIHVLAMLTLIGQALHPVRLNIKNQEIDLRVHSFAIQRSGSGKDPAFNFMGRVAEKADMNMAKISSLTSAALIGTIEKGGNITYGAARTSDIVAFKEASTIFNMASSEHSKDIINNINMCVDVGGHIRKELAHQKKPIEYYTHISLFGTTFPPASKNIYIDSGLLPRMLVSYKHINSDFYYNVVDWMFKNAGTSQSPNINSINELSETLKIISREAKNDLFFNFDNEREAFKNVSLTLKEVLGNYPLIIQERSEPFISRMAAYSLKLSCIYSTLDNLSEHIKKEHVDQANNVIRYSMTSILDFISAYDSNTSSDMIKNTELIRIYLKNIQKKGNNNIEVSALFKLMYPNISNINDMNKYLHTLENLNVITISHIVTDTGPKKVINIL